VSGLSTTESSPKALGLAAATAVAGLTGTLILHFVDPNQPGHYPICPTYALAGVYCPGCGALRAVHNLTLGNLGAAWTMNPLVVLATPYLLWAWAAWVRRATTGRPRSFLAPGWLIMALAFGLVAYGVARNIGGLEFLAPH
jgi:hypothetical protein